MSDSNTNPSTSPSTDTDNSNQPGMIHGHAAYLAGAAKESLGSLTSTSLQSSGAQDKQAGLDEMRAAKAQNESEGQGEVGKNETLGSVEKMAGSVTGCEGMKDEGGKRQGL